MNEKLKSDFSSENETTFDKSAFRLALGNFATGVTIVTASDEAEQWVGVTANSFNSVSLEPPLILWSLDRSAWSLPTFEQADHFVVNVLAEHQLDISNRFARQGEPNKFHGVPIYMGVGNTPVLSDSSVSFQCRKKFTYDGGDHLIFVGEVVDFASTDKPALLYYRGNYAISCPHPGIK